MFTEKLVEVVTGHVAGSMESRTLTILANAKTKPYTQLRHLCATVGSATYGWEAIAKVVMAGAVFNPNQVHEWMEILIEPFKSIGLVPKPSECPNYWRGVTLGLFEVATWQDHCRESLSEFEKKFPKTIILLTTLPEDSAGGNKVSPDWERWEGRLSTAVKAYIRGVAENRHRRLADVYNILQGLAKRICHEGNLEKSGDNLPKQSQILINQISYAVFGEYPEYAARLGMVTGFFEKLFQPSGEQTAA